MQRSPTYLLQLDGLRCLAILMVLFGHWAQWAYSWPPLVHYSFNNGVTLFFVISGFLITGILIANRENLEKGRIVKLTYFSSFFTRRILRIFPIYYLSIVVFYLLNEGRTRELLPWLLTYTLNVYQSFHQADLDNLGHLWSLAVEEQFYLVWPVLIAFIKPRYFPALFLSLIGFSLLFKAYCYVVLHNWMASAYLTLSCMDALGLGALLAYLKHYSKSNVLNFLRRIPIFPVLIIQLMLVISTRYFQMRGYSYLLDTFLFSIFSMLLILRIADGGFKGLAGRFFSNGFVVHIGKISYAIYLYHQMTPRLLDKIALMSGLDLRQYYYLSLIYTFLLTIALAQLSWIIIEKPVNSLKQWFPYGR